MFKDKVVWITGASSGIGEALALALIVKGAVVVLSARNENALRAVKVKCDALSDHDKASMVLPLDVTNEQDIPSVLGQIVDQYGGVDMLINNAGISQRSSCLNTDMSTYRRIFDVDVFGQIAVTKAVLPVMIEQGHGHIAVTSSVAGKIGAPFRTGYSAAKHAVMGFFDALRTEVNHHNIKVTTITPGFIRTNISENALAGDGSTFGQQDSDIRGGMDVDVCARDIVRGFEKGKREIPVGVGSEMHALWIKRFFPKMLLKIMDKQYKKAAKRDNYS